MRRPSKWILASAFLILVAMAPLAHSQTYSISGTISIEGSTDWAGGTVWIDEFHIAYTNSVGRYEINGLGNGTYEVHAWKENCLARIIGTVTITDLDVFNVNGMLFAGDLWEDGRINLHDTRVLLDHYLETPDSSGWEDRLDIIHDNEINSLDIDLLALRWHDSADSELPRWPLEVVAPNAAMTWNVGQIGLPVRWGTGNLGGEVSIDLYKAGLRVAVLAEATKNDGEFLIPVLLSGLVEGDDYRVHVFYDEENQDLSEYFSVNNAMMVISPNSGTTWYMGMQDVTVSWNPGYETGDVSIFLMTYDTIVETIATATPNDGLFEEYDVPLSMISHGGYRVEIVSGLGYSTAGENFGIRNGLEVYTPDSTSAWWPGWYAQIKWWNRAGSTSPVSLYLYKGDEQRYTIVEGRAYDLEFYDWIAPADAAPGDDYRVKVSYDESPGTAGFSDYFGIRPRFEVTRPNGNTTWYTGQQGVAVQWEDSDVGGMVSISLMLGSIQIEELASSTPNDGSFIDYQYTLPLGLEESNNYRVRIYHDEKYNDYSDYFEIADPPVPGGYGWIQASPGFALWDVTFRGPSMAVAVGNNGRLLSTADGGDTWIESNVGIYSSIYGVSFSDAMNGTAVGIDGIVLDTGDGGMNWERQGTGITSALFDVSRIDGQTAIAVGEGGMVIRTLDGGSSWEVLPGGVSDDLKAVHFIDAMEGWAAGHSSRMIRTADGGDSWTVFDNGFNHSIEDICFYDGNTGATIGNGCDDGTWCGYTIMMTSDGGSSWQLSKYSQNFYEMYGIAFADASRITAAGKLLDVSNDGGLTWTRRTNYMFYKLNGIAYADDGIGMAVGSAGEIIRTLDYGATWRSVGAVDQNMMDVEFTGPDTAVAVGKEGVILKTINGGASWYELNAGGYYGPTLIAVSFSDADTGMVIGYGATIMSTVDGGLTWTDRTGYTTTNLYGVELNRSVHPIIVGSEGLIIQSADNGATWTELVSGTTNILRAVSFGSPDHGTIVGHGGIILRTTNGGFTWMEQESGVTTDLCDVEFIDAFNGFAIGSSGVILRTSDGGENWEPVSSGINAALNSLAYSGIDEITIVGSAGTVLRSTDRGETWTVQPSYTVHELKAVSFGEGLNGVIVGIMGRIFYTTTGGE